MSKFSMFLETEVLTLCVCLYCRNLFSSTNLFALKSEGYLNVEKKYVVLVSKKLMLSH